MRCAQALSGQLSAFERHEIVAACKEYGGIVIQIPMWGKLELAPPGDWSADRARGSVKGAYGTRITL
jgi:hypothetical protein